MKRLFMAVAVAMLSITATFAEEENAANVNNVNAYDMSLNIRRLGVTLGLTTDQMESVADIHHTFCGEMMMAAQANKDERQTLVDKAVLKDLKYMNYILTVDQFKKYRMLLNVTLNNRGLNK